MLVYLHGFNSSPQSFKARLLRERLARAGREAELIAPALPHWPAQAIAIVERVLVESHPRTVTLIGSSLGGYYATWLAERYGLRAILVNPAIRPHALLTGFIGTQTNLYTGERYTLTAQHIEQLQDLDVEEITDPARYLLLVAMADEVLDSRVALQKYRGARQIVDPAGDHGFSDFARHIDAILEFAACEASAPPARRGG